jgi:hypothetical protein
LFELPAANSRTRGAQLGLHVQDGLAHAD